MSSNELRAQMALRTLKIDGHLLDVIYAETNIKVLFMIDAYCKSHDPKGWTRHVNNKARIRFQNRRLIAQKCRTEVGERIVQVLRQANTSIHIS